MPARSVCLVTLSLSEAGPGRFGRQVSVTDIYHTIPYQRLESCSLVQFSSARICCTFSPTSFSSVQFSSVAVPFSSVKNECPLPPTGAELLTRDVPCWQAGVGGL